MPYCPQSPHHCHSYSLCLLSENQLIQRQKLHMETGGPFFPPDLGSMSLLAVNRQRKGVGRLIICLVLDALWFANVLCKKRRSESIPYSCPPSNSLGKLVHSSCCWTEHQDGVTSGSLACVRQVQNHPTAEPQLFCTVHDGRMKANLFGDYFRVAEPQPITVH